MPDLGRCVRFGSPLQCVRGTVLLMVRCRGCRRGGEIVHDGSGRCHAYRGPAVDPTFGSGRSSTPLVTDGGEVTGADKYLCHLCGRLREGLGAALLCCSDAFDDPEIVTDGGTTDVRGHAPDDRNIDDIIAVEGCQSCSWSPAAVILVDGEWECYNCGLDPERDQP